MYIILEKAMKIFVYIAKLCI